MRRWINKTRSWKPSKRSPPWTSYEVWPNDRSEIRASFGRNWILVLTHINDFLDVLSSSIRCQWLLPLEKDAKFVSKWWFSSSFSNRTGIRISLWPSESDADKMMNRVEHRANGRLISSVCTCVCLMGAAFESLHASWARFPTWDFFWRSLVCRSLLRLMSVVV